MILSSELSHDQSKGLCSRVIQLTASSRLRSDCAAPAVHGGPRLRGTHRPSQPVLLLVLVHGWTRYPDPRICEL